MSSPSSESESRYACLDTSIIALVRICHAWNVGGGRRGRHTSRVKGELPSPFLMQRHAGFSHHPYISVSFDFGLLLLLAEPKTEGRGGD
jgi:hypothetical protein